MSKLLPDHGYHNEEARRGEILLTQPVGGGVVMDYTWGQTMDQAQRTATYRLGPGLEPGARIALLAPLVDGWDQAAGPVLWA